MAHAGVAHTKLMAKLCSGLNKPNMQTLLPAASAPHLLRDLPLTKLKGLGGQLGQHVQETLQVKTAGAPAVRWKLARRLRHLVCLAFAASPRSVLSISRRHAARCACRRARRGATGKAAEAVW